MSGAGPLPKDVVPCRACGADMVFLRTKKGTQMPVNVIPTQSKYRGPNAGEASFVYGQHQPHWATCPEADSFRGK